jgi:short-subunit dehydrogenase
LNHWLIIGRDGGLGSACQQILQARHETITAFSRQDLDLSDSANIMHIDLSPFDIVINCTGHNKGMFRGFLDNDYRNIVDLIQVNYIANLLILKNYATNRKHGRYVWINSSTTQHPTVYQSMYASSKAASKFALDLIKQEAHHINITECYVGLTKTKMRYAGYCGTKSYHLVDQEYDKLGALDAMEVAKRIIDAVDHGQESAVIV